ncbi:NAD kinase [Fluviicola taffensis]|uniref:NAD kinase n=1 Tax=Fluviicola taffensis (strain DSM 16823 / NCIMB 13979 / RW262) TaxID=755732 RepID=F2IB37_FLUTR|nr:NAD kinase [Fluviicola taffensis]AEA42120.1 inorganic polyphosphate/ATP-NAD kinase [Fluviicola taffensis DSM 16823]
MRVALYSKKVTKATIPVFVRFAEMIHRFGWKLVLEKELKEQLVKKAGMCLDADVFTRHEDFHNGIDLAFSIGGDGTFLRTVSFIRNSGVPILGINTGRLGFLANISDLQFEEALELVRQKRYDYQKRSLLRVETERSIYGPDNVAMNEVTLLKKDTSSMITVNTFLEDKYLNSYWADGLIVATPTGSTAYNLSCGGPIVTPGCQVHIITPIAPHNLNVRPVVVPDNMPIRLSIEGRERNYLISLDGNAKSIKQNEEVLIRKAEYMINVIKLEDTNFLDTIRNKMSWGKDQRN